MCSVVHPPHRRAQSIRLDKRTFLSDVLSHFLWLVCLPQPLLDWFLKYWERDESLNYDTCLSICQRVYTYVSYMYPMGCSGRTMIMICSTAGYIMFPLWKWSLVETIFITPCDTNKTWCYFFPPTDYPFFSYQIAYSRLDHVVCSCMPLCMGVCFTGCVSSSFHATP